MSRAGIALVVVLLAAPAQAFQIEWQAEPARRGGARLAGTHRAWVPGVLFSGDRVYFEIPVPQADAAYRVSVETFDWFRCGD